MEEALDLSFDRLPMMMIYIYIYGNFSGVHLTLLLMPFTITWIFRSNDPPLTKYATHKAHKENQLRRNDSAGQQILSRLNCLQSVRTVYNIRTTWHELSLNCLLA